MSRKYTITCEERQVTNQPETVKSYGVGRLHADRGDHVFTFCDGELSFVCSHEQFEKLFPSKPKSKSK